MKALAWFWNNTIQTSEAKALLIGFGWAGLARIFDQVPLTLPPLDLTAQGMGIVTLSPGALAIYVLGRVIVKAVTKGQIPFWPDPEDRVAPSTP